MASNCVLCRVIYNGKPFLIGAFFFQAIFLCQLEAKVSSFEFNRNKPIEITADQFIVTDNEKRGEFVGNVNVVQDKYNLNAKRIIILYSDKKSQDNVIKTITAFGDVHLFVDSKQAAKAQKIIYNLEASTLELSDDVLLIYNENTLKSEKITLNTQTNLINVEGSSKQRVKALINITNQQ